MAKGQIMNQEGIMRSQVKESEGQPAGCNVGWMKHERQALRGHTTGTQVIAVTSGKGGVGKTSVVANLGYALTRLNKRVLLVDADIGLANLDVILGFSPRYNLQHVLSGEKPIGEVVITTPEGMKILPAGSGIQELTELTKSQKLCLLSELESLSRGIDIILIDTSAGISSNVMYFNLAAHEILMVVSPEPTSITDAYAMMKVLCLKYEENHFNLLVNGAQSAEEAKEVYNHISLVGQRFHHLSIDYWGYIVRDEHVIQAVRQQKALVELYPEAAASQCIFELAQKVCEHRLNAGSRGAIRFFWHHFLENPESFPLSLSRI
jgi:flagellar biosynthesis protein FlhG